ncbi:hypothetical protein E1B28_002134 [Marasmius oreades]|uniref:Uncharacterized protein n=1 Tax=Marasmius oreades TaxID=181124 RepID=A0A9P7UKZ0_9AGAR|nr:uncharacterized protein E1B28_002134 [Marasmius oreades]KAG7086178.1 hypothetical protein E1B28_002134 [Marasmius oreades]
MHKQVMIKPKHVIRTQPPSSVLHQCINSRFFQKIQKPADTKEVELSDHWKGTESVEWTIEYMTMYVKEESISPVTRLMPVFVVDISTSRVNCVRLCAGMTEDLKLQVGDHEDTSTRNFSENAILRVVGVGYCMPFSWSHGVWLSLG